MHIGFDAKRAFYNRSGLGNYSRDTIRALCQFYPDNEYFLYTPSLKKSISFIQKDPRIHFQTPECTIGKVGQAYWRSFQLNKRLLTDRIDIYHGLSNEIPYFIKKRKTKTVITIHDLIFLRHPEWYRPIDKIIYKHKFSYGSRAADRVITVSRQTREDLITYFGIDRQKIDVVYQSCNDAFKTILNQEQKLEVSRKWMLPGEYILYVGTVEERKNLLNLIRAMHQKNMQYPLVVVGKHTHYIKKIKEYIRKYSIQHIYFLKEVPVTDLPGIYQMATLFVYPSVYEGFGIPILEALYSQVPVITSKEGCFIEVGGENSQYIDPLNTNELGETIMRLLNDSSLREDMKISGYRHAQQFSFEKSVQQLMNIYNMLINE